VWDEDRGRGRRREETYLEYRACRDEEGGMFGGKDLHLGLRMISQRRAWGQKRPNDVTKHGKDESAKADRRTLMQSAGAVAIVAKVAAVRPERRKEEEASIRCDASDLSSEDQDETDIPAPE
jgi:hypothetical protein